MAARTEGHQVEAVADRTEFSQTFANPSGTLTLHESAVPVMARRPEGSWAPVDTTLRTRPDGRVAPAVGVVDVSFSGGGTGALARIARDGRQLSLVWPGRLPRPRLRGDTATYADVLPGVDLEVKAQPLGFSDLLVVSTPQAARNPALATVRFAVSASGLSPLPTSAGGLTAVDGLDREVFGAPAPSMWDASGATSAVGMRVSAGELDLTPDQRMLGGAGTRFPVSIDPYVVWTGVKEAWTKVDACFPNQTYWNGANDPDSSPPRGQVKVGRAPVESGDSCSGTTWRSYFQMDTSRVAGKQVASASFNVFDTYAASCASKPADLYWSGSVSSSTDWNHQPGATFQIEKSFAHGYSSSCDPNWESFDVGWAVWTTANDKGSTITLMLRAPNEGLCNANSSRDTCQWHKFDSGAISGGHTPYLSIEYNTPPNAPTNLYTEGSPYLYPGGRIPCGSIAHYVGTTTPTLHADISDPDDTASSQPQALIAEYGWVWSDPSGKTGIDGANVPKGGGFPGSGRTSVPTQATIPSGDLANGDVVGWHVQTSDGIAASGPTPASGTSCPLVVNTTPQTTEPAVSSSDGKYPPGGAGTQVGTPGQFTFDPNGATDVAGFVYGLNTTTPWRFVPASGLGSTAAVTIVPAVVGPNQLVVRVIGLGGVLGPVHTYDVVTTHPIGGVVAPLAQWAMDEGSGSTAHDGAGGHDASAAGTFSWVAGHTGASADRGLHLSSSSPGGHVSTSEPAVDTRYGYTVSAWVQLADTNGSHTVLSQEGASNAAFYLEYYSAPNRWAFAMPVTDGTGPVIVHAVSDAAPKVGVWTHLVGVYCNDPSCLAPGDTAPGRLYLYVDDGGGLQLQASQPAFSSPWMSMGAVDIGRGLYNGVYTSNLNGAVDDVAIYWGDPCPAPQAAGPSTCAIP
jgi:hypothetical protein